MTHVIPVTDIDRFRMVDYLSFGLYVFIYIYQLFYVYKFSANNVVYFKARSKIFVEVSAYLKLLYV